MSFFQQFPIIDYDLQETNQFSKRFDIFRHVDVSTTQSDEFTSYLYYQVKDGERPDIVSYKLYDTPDYYWTFFVINDFLQAGFNEWYKSSFDFHRGLELEYDDHGALIFLPSYLPPDLTNTADRVENAISGLDVTYSDLRLARVGSSPQDTAKIERFDPFMLQLITHEASSDSFYNSSGTYHFAFSSTATNAGKTAWLKIYTDHLKSVNVYDQAGVLEEGDLSTYTYTPERAYSSLLDAPFRFKSTVVDQNFEADVVQTTEKAKDDVIGAYDSLIRGQGDITNFKSWYEYELDKNEANRQIQYVRPEFIEQFADEYKALINL
tara:strand:+ start:1160 stop:2125 length:966 start_codon:yes stop_codon:yes gene_type:complete